ncbi:MAG: AMP-binding protein [Alphaproteobacteria bacterium]|nr:AMP-binding protein [Alphaproteobacteria bacterium]MBV9418481.1 AMP-binding protein [Alphaproteobacteria bacterium]
MAAASGEECVAFDINRSHKPVFHALVDARSKFGADKVALIDGDERALTYEEIIRAALALGHALKKGTKVGESVGIMLPTGAGSVIAFFAVSAYGRVPTMMNFTAGLAGIRSALKTAKVKRIVTARRFVELAKAEPIVEAMEKHYDIVYLEDVREKLSLIDKLYAAVGTFVPSLVASHALHSTPAVILFTSGTEGEPKGVALSHANLLSNVEQVRAHLPLYETDILFNPLPTFHCFGLTVGSLMPLILGIKVVTHPTPLQPREIVKRIRETGATILLSTDTFISQYARAGDQGDLNSLRLTVCGAERLRDETRALLRKKYSIELLEGYGVTEAAPVIAANQPDANHPGTVGKLMQHMEARLDPVEGISNAGRLFVRGPNVMLGYIKSDQPGVIQPPEGGWHDTGDIVSIDDEGFIAIKGRMKRFAKIGGESVSLAVVESIASALWPDHNHAAITVPDGRKGEQIVLVTTNKDASRHDLVGWAHNHGVSELAVPRRILPVDEIPVLGTGKTDYVTVEKTAKAAAAA